MKKAFTLIELIATIVILGIVTSIVSIIIMNVIRNVKDSARKRSIDNYGRIIETSMAEYQSQYLKYPDSIDQLEIEYVGSVIECETRRINPDKTIYLSECKVNGKKVLDKKTEDGYYHYGTLVLTNEEYVDKLGNNIELALKDYYKENNKYPINYRLLNLPKLDKDVNCVSHINPDGTVYLTKCSIDGSYILNENEEDGYYHYGKKSIYDYVDNEGNGYTKVTYLESTGSQYIDTGIIPNVNQKYEIKLEMTSLENQVPFGSRSSGDYLTSKDQVYLNVTSDAKGLIFSGTKSTILDDNFSINKLYEFQNDLTELEGDFNNMSNQPIYLFALNNSSNAVAKSTMKLYYFKIYDGNKTIREYVPVKDTSNVGCLYDKVERKCYYSAEENFNYQDVMDGVSINYLMSTGTQYINTGIIPNINQKYEIKLEMTSSGNQVPFGSRSSGDYLTSKDQVYLNVTFDGKLLLFSGTKSNILDDNFSIDKLYEFQYDLTELEGDFNNMSNQPLYLFALNNSSNAVAKSTMKLYYFKVLNGNDLIRDYIPYLDEIGKPCLFDKVAKKCYYNQGTGEFLYG